METRLWATDMPRGVPGPVTPKKGKKTANSGSFTKGHQRGGRPKGRMNKMDVFTKLFGEFLVFVYHCFDRIVIHRYLTALSRPELVVHFFGAFVRWRSARCQITVPGEAAALSTLIANVAQAISTARGGRWDRQSDLRAGVKRQHSDCQ